MKTLFTYPKIIFTVFIGLGLFLLTTNVIRQLTWEKATGIVREVKERKDDRNQFYPLVEFKTNTGAVVAVAIKQSSNRFHYQVGEQIPIIYPVANFKKAKINSSGWVYGFPLIFIILGIIGMMIPSELWYKS
ncbi:MAG: DUF3592 domain-containing protein [Saprospiraceae bacterium]